MSTEIPWHPSFEQNAKGVVTVRDAAKGATTISEQITETWAKIAEIQETAIRKYALALLGEEAGEPAALMRRLAVHIREMAGPRASLVWCVVNLDALPPGVSHESYLAIDTGEEGSAPVRIGPVMRIGMRGELIALPKSADRP